MTTEIKYHTREETLQAVTQNGKNLKFCSPELRNNEEVVMAAIKENELSFCYASNELKSNKVFIIKALHEGAHPCGLIKYAKISIQSDIEVISLALEKSYAGQEFQYTKGEAALNKELAAKALVKWGNWYGKNTINLWEKIVPTLQEFFPKDIWHEKAQAYLIQLEHQIKQEKQAEMVTGGSTTEDEVVW